MCGSRHLTSLSGISVAAAVHGWQTHNVTETTEDGDEVVSKIVLPNGMTDVI